MDSTAKNRVQVRIFVGFELKVDVSIFLNQNSDWKQAVVSQSTSLQIVHYHNKDYIGVYLPHKLITIKSLQEQAKEVREELIKYCPEKTAASLKISIFPQVFVS
jgi:ABC-type Zn uptake system ZnuABC Zn-binding protein ZnuA